VNEQDAQTSTEHLLEEYSRIVTLTDRREYALRVNEIIEEIRRRGAFDLGSDRPPGQKAKPIASGNPEETLEHNAQPWVGMKREDVHRGAAPGGL
jgi:hypothetical protein